MNGTLRRIALSALVLSVLGGCAVYAPADDGYAYYPSGPAYVAPGPVYVAPPPVYVGPPVSLNFGFGYWGGRHYHGGWHGRGHGGWHRGHR